MPSVHFRTDDVEDQQFDSAQYNDNHGLSNTSLQSGISGDDEQNLEMNRLDESAESISADLMVALEQTHNSSLTEISRSEQLFRNARKQLRKSENQGSDSIGMELEDVRIFLSSLKHYVDMSTEPRDLSNTTSDTFQQSRITGAGLPGTANRFSMSSQKTTACVAFPSDFYSFLVFYGPVKHPFFFSFGFMVFLFQFAFLLFAILSVVHPEWNTHEDVDNPSDSWIATFIPSNVSFLVRATQVVAVLSYCIFADASVKDVITAIEIWPSKQKMTTCNQDMYWCMVFSCSLRAVQGFMTIIATFLRIMTQTDVMDIILDFLALNFISNLSRLAFDLALWGKYGPALEQEVRKVSNQPMPRCMLRLKHNNARSYVTLSMVSVTLCSLLIAIIVGQENQATWSTQTMRVQISDNNGQESFSGCYKAADYKMEGFQNRKRKIYESYENNTATARFGYCKRERRWYFFESERYDACELEDEEIIAKSMDTISFDISTSFKYPWLSMHGTPLDIYFFDEMNEEEIEKTCSSFLNDGKCDEVFNNFEYDWDGGDCCASTCTNPDCGTDALRTAFGQEILYGDGFPDCKDPSMVPVTIRIDDVVDSRNFTTIDGPNEGIIRPSFESMDIMEPMMMLDCDDVNVFTVPVATNKKGQSETVNVEDAANCTIRINNATTTNRPMLYVNYTVFHGDKKAMQDNPIVILQEASSNSEFAMFERVPECYLEKLSRYIDNTTIYTGNSPQNLAMKWLRGNSRHSRSSRCDDDFFLERYALSTFNFAAPIMIEKGDSYPPYRQLPDFMYYKKQLWINPHRQCIWRSVECSVSERSVEGLHLRGFGIHGTIPPTIELLSNLANLDVANNYLYGTIPTEIGLLTSLRTLNLDQNSFSGTIPTEIGALTGLEFLDLYNNTLTGTIPKELKRLVAEYNLTTIHVGGNDGVTTRNLSKEMEDAVYTYCVLCNKTGIPSQVILSSCKELILEHDAKQGILSISDCTHLKEVCLSC